MEKKRIQKKSSPKRGRPPGSPEARAARLLPSDLGPMLDVLSAARALRNAAKTNDVAALADPLVALCEAFDLYEGKR